MEVVEHEKDVSKNVKEWRELSSTSIGVKVEFCDERWVFVNAYRPTMEKRENDNDRTSVFEVFECIVPWWC